MKTNTHDTTLFSIATPNVESKSNAIVPPQFCDSYHDLLFCRVGRDLLLQGVR